MSLLTITKIHPRCQVSINKNFHNFISSMPIIIVNGINVKSKSPLLHKTLSHRCLLCQASNCQAPSHWPPFSFIPGSSVPNHFLSVDFQHKRFAVQFHNYNLYSKNTVQLKTSVCKFVSYHATLLTNIASKSIVICSKFIHTIGIHKTRHSYNTPRPAPVSANR